MIQGIESTEVDMPPRALASSAAIEERLGRIDDDHVAPLNSLVRHIRDEQQAVVPWFDPNWAGVQARVLLLLEAPGRRAAGTASRQGSGFVSPENDDQTAENVYTLSQEAGLTAELVAHWNIVPWYLGSAEKVRAANASDVTQARSYLRALVGALTRLRVVVAMGRQAQRGWARYIAQHTPDVATVPCPHPSPRVFNTTPNARHAANRALTWAASLTVD